MTLVAPTGVQDKDSYDRLLRYVVNPAGRDSGLHQIEGGWADARYDSTDGYDHHDHESAYHAADRERWRDNITECSPDVEGDSLAQEAATKAKAEELAASAALAKAQADAAAAELAKARAGAAQPPAAAVPVPPSAKPAPAKPAPAKPAPVKPAPAPALPKPPAAAPKPTPPPAPAPKPVPPAPDKYTGCRAYGPGGTSIDDKGRPYTKIDCTTRLPI